MDSPADDIPNSYDELELQVDFSDEENGYNMETSVKELLNETAYSIIETAEKNIETAENNIETAENNIKTAENNVCSGLSIRNNIFMTNGGPTRHGNSYGSLADHNYHKNSKKNKQIQYCSSCYLEVNQISLKTHQTYCRERIFKCSSNKVAHRNERRLMRTYDIKIHQAINAIFEGFDVKVASNVFGLEENTLREKLQWIGAKIPQDNTLDNIIGAHLKLLQKKCFKLSEYSIRRIAYELARIHKKVNVNIYGLADELWYTQFIKSRPVLADLRADFIDRNAMMSYQKLMILQFFESYVQIIVENYFDRNTIYTVETASIVLSSQEDVLNPKTDKRASIIVAANSLGDMSPAVISSTFNLHQTEDDDSLILEDQTIGKIDSETFKKFAINFINYVKDKKRSYLLLLNENDYFSQSYETYNILKQANIHILGVPNIMVNKLPLGCLLFNKIIGRMQLIIHDKHMDGDTVVTNFSNLFSWGKNLTPPFIYTHLKNGFLNCGLLPIDKGNALQWIQETMGKSSKNIFRLVYQEQKDDQMEDNEIEDDQIQDNEIEEDQIQEYSRLNLERTNLIIKQEHSPLNLEKTNPIVKQKLFKLNLEKKYPTVKQEVFDTSEYISEKLVQLSEVTSGDCSTYERPKTPEILDRYINESVKYTINKEVKVNLTRLPEKFLKRLKKRKSLNIKKKPIGLLGYKRKRKRSIKCPVCYKFYKESNGDQWIQCAKCKGWTHELCATLTDKTYFFCVKCVLI